MRMTLAQIQGAAEAHRRRSRQQLMDQLIVARGAQATEESFEQLLESLKDV